MSKRIELENIDKSELIEIIKKEVAPLVAEAVKEEIKSSFDQYANVPDELSSSEVKKYFNLTKYKINQAVKLNLITRKNIGWGEKKCTYRYFKDELIDYVNKSKK